MSEIQPCNRGLSAPHPPHPHLSQTGVGGLGFEYDFKKELGSVSLVKREAASGVAWFLDLLKYPELKYRVSRPGGWGGGSSGFAWFLDIQSCKRQDAVHNDGNL